MWGGPFRYLILGLACFAGAAVIYTLHERAEEKIRRMRMVRGELPGANFMEAKLVTLDSRDGDSGGRIFWMEFGFEHEKMKTTHRKELSRMVSARLREGNPVRVARLKNDPDVYVPTGVWASDENLEFSLSLRALARFGAGFLALPGLCSAGAAFFVKPTPGS